MLCFWPITGFKVGKPKPFTVGEKGLAGSAVAQQSQVSLTQQTRSGDAAEDMRMRAGDVPIISHVRLAWDAGFPHSSDRQLLF